MNDFIRTPRKRHHSEYSSIVEATDTSNEIQSAKPKHWWLPHFRHVHLSRQQWLLVGGSLIVLVAVGAYAAPSLYRHFSRAKITTIAKTNPKPKPTTEASRLTGVMVDPTLNKRPVTAIMIENSPDARPQSGLKDAGVVYEAIAEGGITRFLTLFEEAQPDYIGPVRSARPYYLDWLLPFDPSYAHVGGSNDALAQIKDLGIKDLNQFANGDSYWRISQRVAPHNVYTSFAKLDALNQSKGYTSSNFTGFVRKKEEPAKPPTVTTIDFNISAAVYNPHYDYDAATNSYHRSEGNMPHMDEKSSTQLSPKVVVALVMNKGSHGVYTDYTTTGTGQMFVFQDGTVTQGTWQKPDRKSQFVFSDTKGAVLKLNPGQTWLSIVSEAGAVTYK